MRKFNGITTDDQTFDLSESDTDRMQSILTMMTMILNEMMNKSKSFGLQFVLTEKKKPK